MTKEEKELLTKVLCEQLPHEVKYKDAHGCKEVLDIWSPGFHTALNTIIGDGRPSLYLRPLPSMTESEARGIAKLYHISDSELLDVKVTVDGIDITLDDNFCSCEKEFIRFDEIVTSVEIFDYLNAKHFDIRGLIPMGLAIAAVGKDNPYKEKWGEE